MNRRVVLILLLAVPVALVAGAWLWVKAAESRRWAQLEQRVADLAREADRRHCPRPVLRGTALPGDAWDDYIPAIDLVQDLADHHSIQRYAHSADESNLAQVRPLVSPYLPAIERMRQGTRRAESRRVRLHEKQQGAFDEGWLKGTLRIAYVSMCRARWLAVEGKTCEAAELLTDLFKYGEDVAADGSEIALVLGSNIFEIAMEGLRSLLTQGRLSGEECRRISHELEQLDDTFPRFGPVLLARLEYFGTWLLNGSDLNTLRRVGCIPANLRIRPGWREAFSLPLMQAAGFDQTEAWSARLLSVDEGSAVDEEDRWRKAFAERADSTNMYFLLFTNQDGIPDARALRAPRARLRLLRMAAHYRATGEFLELPGFGHTVEPKAVHFWGDGIETFTLPSGSKGR